MPVKNTKRRTNDGLEGVITGLTEEEKDILNSAISGGALLVDTVDEMNALLEEKDLKDGQLCYCKETTTLYVLENNTWVEASGGKAKTVTVKQSDLEKANSYTDNTDILNELKKDLGNTVLQIVNDSGEIVGEFKFGDKYYYDGYNRYSFIGWFRSTEGNSRIAGIGKQNYPLFIAKALFIERSEGKWTLEVYVDRGASGSNTHISYSGDSGNIRFSGISISNTLGGIELLSSVNQSQIRIQNAYVPANSYFYTDKAVRPLCLFNSFDFSDKENAGVLLGFKNINDETSGQNTKSGYLFLGFENLTDTIYPSGYSTDNGHKLVLSNKVPDCPTSADGTYTLKAVVSGGTVTYQWVKD